VRFYNVLADRGLDAVAPPNQSLSLNADLLWEFDEQDLSHYRLFNVDYVIAPPSVRLPAELRALATTPKYVLYAAPGRGYAGYAAIARREPASTNADLFAKELAWLRGGNAARWSFTRFDYPHAASDTFAPIADCPSGRIASERVQPARFDLVVRCDTASAIVVKVTYHPNWRVTVDGSAVATFMVSPSLIGFAVPPGEHSVVAEYRSTPIKTPLLILGGVVVALAAATSQRRRLAAASPEWVRGAWPPLHAQWAERRARRD
jgi:hypothetical protein